MESFVQGWSASKKADLKRVWAKEGNMFPSLGIPWAMYPGNPWARRPLG